MSNNKPSVIGPLVVGSGFIGLEMVENLKTLGINVPVVEMKDHLMKPLDKDVPVYLKEASVFRRWLITCHYRA